MKYLSFLLLFFCFQSYGQITGNRYVTDSAAIVLDATASNQLLGKWKLVETVESMHDAEQQRARGLLVAFEKNGQITTSWCVGCHEEETGQWKIRNKRTLLINDSRAEANRYLAGEWAVYTLTDKEMVLAKVLTSSGDWKKLHYFSRDVDNPPLTKTDRYCINCSENSAWCWGDKPDKAKEYWALVHDQLAAAGDQLQPSGALAAGFDWLLQNAPCINNALYINATNYYKKLLGAEKNEQTIKLYQEKLKQIAEQQQLYFKQ